MGYYRVEFKASAESDLRGIPFPFRRQINGSIFKLKAHPRPAGCRDVPEVDGGYRLPLHGYSVLYTVDDADRLVTIYAIVQ